MSLISPGLYLGNINNANNLECLKEKNIKYIINCAKEIPNYFPDNFSYLRLNLEDTLEQDIQKVFNITYKFIDEKLEKGHAVFVHCMAGVSRSATIVIHYLMKKYSVDYKTAYDHVKKYRRIINPNKNFVEQLILEFR